MSEHRHLLSLLVENSPGELARIVGLFSGRGFSIDRSTIQHDAQAGCVGFRRGGGIVDVEAASTAVAPDYGACPFRIMADVGSAGRPLTARYRAH